MPLKIITADERLARKPKINACIFGPPGVGKTYQVRTLDPARTLVLDMEAGLLAAGDWPGDSIDVRKQAHELGVHPWELCRALACLLGGPDPASPGGPYGQAAYDSYRAALGEPEALFGKYDLIFGDSITVASRYSFSWTQQKHPAAFSERTGKPDVRGAYGAHGREMVDWLTALQHQPKSIVLVGILEQHVDDMRRVSWEPQIVGGMAGRELPGIFDQVMTLQTFDLTPEGRLVLNAEGQHRAFVCTKANPFGLPAKDRSGKLAMLEPPDLGALLAKIATAPRLDGQPVRTLPQTPPQPASEQASEATQQSGQPSAA